MAGSEVGGGSGEKREDRVIRWDSACIDRPLAELGSAGRFWSAVTGSVALPERVPGFVGLGTDLGDEWLEIQGVLDGGGGVHLDLSVDDTAAFSVRAERLGASTVAEHGLRRVLGSPAGLLFCVVPWRGETRRPRAFTGPSGELSRVHQVCLDVPPSRFEAEVTFWAELTGWELDTSVLPVFTRLWPPQPMPVRILLQRLGGERPASAHLDVSTSNAAASRAWHESLGATFIGDRPDWTTMRDPAGGVYCLTRGDPTFD